MIPFIFVFILLDRLIKKKSDKDSKPFPETRASSRLPVRKGLGALLSAGQDGGLLELHLFSKQSLNSDWKIC